MKKILASALMLFFASYQPVLAIDGPWGMAYGSFLLGVQDLGSAASTVLDVAFVHDSAGDLAGIKFSSPVNQTAGDMTLYVYCTADTGSPTNSEAIILAGPDGADDDDQPDAGAAALATSANVDATGCDTPEWLTYTFTDSVTLVAGNTYFLGVINTTATPASNNFSVQHRGALDGFIGNTTNLQWMSALVTADGFTTDPTVSLGPAMVVKFDNGDLWGNPFVTATAHASNSNWRGTRFVVNEDIVISCASWGVITSVVADYRIYQGSTQILSITADRHSENNTSAACFPPITLTGGLPYDFVMNTTGASTAGQIYGMGTTPPADVLSIAPNMVTVDGATPGSFSEVANTVMLDFMMLDDNPAQAAGGGNSFCAFSDF